MAWNLDGIGGKGYHIPVNSDEEMKGILNKKAGMYAYRNPLLTKEADINTTGMPGTVGVVGNLIYVFNQSTIDIINGINSTLVTTVNVSSSIGLRYIGVDDTRMYFIRQADSTNYFLQYINLSDNTLSSSLVSGTNNRTGFVHRDKIYIASENTDKVYIYNRLAFTLITTVTVSAPFSFSAATDKNKIYSNSLTSNVITIIDYLTDSIITSINVPIGTTSPGVKQQGNPSVYFNNVVAFLSRNTNEVILVNASSNLIQTTIPVGTTPVDCILFLNYLFVANFGANTVTVIDLITFQVVKTLSVGSRPCAAGTMEVFEDRIFVPCLGADSNTGSVSEIDLIALECISTTLTGSQVRRVVVIEKLAKIFTAVQSAQIVTAFKYQSQGVFVLAPNLIDWIDVTPVYKRGSFVYGPLRYYKDFTNVMDDLCLPNLGFVKQLIAELGGGGSATFSSLGGVYTDNASLVALANSKQDSLVSGTNIKTVNGVPLLGPGNIQINGFEPETIDFLGRVQAASGSVSGYVLSVLDDCFKKGKQDGWLVKLKEFWVPVGDFAGSKIFLVKSGGGAVFNNFVASDYNEKTGYQLSANSSKWVDTNFVPNDNGVVANNISFGLSSTRPNGTTGQAFGFIIGYDGSGSDDKGPRLSEPDGRISPVGGAGFGATAQGYGGTISCTSNTTSLNVYYGGLKAVVIASNLTTAQDRKVTLFRSWRENGNLYYANGGISVYYLANALTDAETKSLAAAIEDINVRIRKIKNEAGIVYLGDSITNGATVPGTDTLRDRYSSLLASKMGLRELNYAQGGRAVNVGGDSTIINATTFYPDLLQLSKTHAVVYLGINDARADGNKNTGGTSATWTNMQNSLTTMLRGFVNNRFNTLCIGAGYATDAGNTACQEAYALACANAALAAKVLYVDPYRLFLDTGSPATYMADSVHPNAVGHAFLAQTSEMVWKLNKLYRRPQIGATTINAGATVTIDVLLLCASLGAGVECTFDDLPDGLILQQAYVSATHNVKLVLFNPTGSNINLPATYATIYVSKNY